MPGVISVIEAKRDGYELDSSQIKLVVAGYSKGTIPDYQMSAFLMAVFCCGMTDRESFLLTEAMIESGDILDLSSISGPKIDKHSTGGVGDKVSLALVPIVAASGIPIAKMSGRGLGHTGGTLDKLESITGFQVELSINQILHQMKSVGGCICAQTASIVPADKKMYALRDVTGTVESIPLIAASIMSKKIAGGADIILLDVKVGSGAFVKDVEQGRRLANLMIAIGEYFGKTVVCELTSMEAPLGQAVGNLIEVKEAADFLQGKTIDNRLASLIFALSNNALTLAGVNKTASEIINDGSAWNKFNEIVAAQDGDISTIDRWLDVKPVATVRAAKSGFVIQIDAQQIGRAALQLGAGRNVKEDNVDPLAGIWLDSVVGSATAQGDVIATLFGSSDCDIQGIVEMVEGAYAVTDSKPIVTPIILETIPVKAFG